MELRVLGGIELVADGHQVPLGGSKPRLLMAVLAARRRQVVSIDALADALWGDAQPPTAKATLQTHISKLRRLLDGSGAGLVNRPPGYVLEIDRHRVDADRFEDGLVDARSIRDTDPRAAIAQLDAALALWRGPPFAEFADTPAVQAEAIRLRELQLVALEERIEVRLDVGLHAAAIGELEASVREHPLRERPWRQLMLALYRSGRQTEALRTAQRIRHQLRDEAGLEPSSALQELEQSIARDDPSLQLGSTVPAPGAPPAMARPRQDLPSSVTRLVGRTSDIERLVEALPSARMLTLTGTGGIGKSRLAEELARCNVNRFADGACAVQLAAIHDETAVLAAVAAALGVEQRPERSLERSVIEVLGPLDMLLLVDNCEHVIGAVAKLVGEIVRWCPGVRILATSREPIGMPGEVVWPVAPLTVPAHGATFDEIASSPSVQVFTARAREATPAFELDERTAPAVAELCTALDGLPLALELAAARMASMSPRQLADRLNERFELLASRHAADPRHRTLVGVVEWSYDQLSSNEQELFDRLSVFAGGFELDTIEQACAHGDIRPRDVAPLVGALVDRSLVVVVQHADDRVRYRQLETLRRFGAEQLGGRTDAAEVRAQHATTFREIAEQASLAMDTEEEGSWSDRLERDFDNLRAAIRSAIADGDADTALRLTVATRDFAFRRMRYEIVGWAEDALSLAGSTDHPMRPTALAIVGYGGFVRGELDRAIDFGQQAVVEHARLAVPSTGLAERVLMNAVSYQGDRVQALRWADGMLAGARSTGDPGRVAHGLFMHSVALSSIGEPELAVDLARQGQRAAEQSGSPTALARAAYAAALPLGSADPERSLALLDSAADLAGSVGGRWMRAFALTQAMWLRSRQGDTETALRGYREVVETWYRGGDWANQWLSLRQLAGILASAGRDEEAALLFGAVSAAGASTALPFAPSDADTLHRVGDEVEQRLGSDQMVETQGRGRRMRDEVVIAMALGAIDDLVD